MNSRLRSGEFIRRTARGSRDYPAARERRRAHSTLATAGGFRYATAPMSEENNPSQDPASDATQLASTSPDEVLARWKRNVKMTSGAGGAWQPPTAEEMARLFPGYEILRLLGHGGMGAVYQARQIDLDRFVAIKLLPLEISVDKEFSDRFVREARTMARLNHPNIITVHESGTTTAGHLFFVMEFVEGANLQEIIHGPGLEPARALEIIGAVCDALDYAHTEGVIHRDIKPANVMVDTRGRVKVADFGLARHTAPGAEEMGHTVTGTVMGTPDYMAPEQARGMNVDHRADIYSLGVVLYEMICKDLPKGVFEPPSHRMPVDARLDQVVMTAMARAPEKRFQRTSEMKSAVDAIRATPPTQAGPSPPGSSATTQLLAPAAPPESPTASRTQSVVPIAAPEKLKRLAYGGVAVACIAAGLLWAKPTKPDGNGRAPAVPASIGDSGGKAAKDVSFSDATKDAPLVNTLGMKFVPVPITGGPTNGMRVLFCEWETRVEDYEAFTQETKREWPKPTFAQGPTHPAVNMNWEDARAFCAWLTQREHQAGRLDASVHYRLPSDHEWSCAVGIGEREDPGKTPEEKNRKIDDAFPWGGAWPPPPGAGNYSGEEAVGREDVRAKDMVKEQEILAGYRDEFPVTAPVGSFSANRSGLFDLGGNAWEWCEDLNSPKDDRRVLRGASFLYAIRDELLSSVRAPKPPAQHNFNCGFRVVLSSLSPSAATQEEPFVNDLGMQFVPVPIAGGPTNGQRVLFSIWETRVGDYEAYVKETKREWLKPRFLQDATHPVVNVSWGDAQEFGTWLTERARQAGALPANWRYRLPTDHEWSCAVGIGDREDAAQAPQKKSEGITGEFPWGGAWPPPPGAGNYSGAEAADHEISPGQKTLDGYRDSFPHTSPVGSFAANLHGLFDFGGNAREWCHDAFDAGQRPRVLRGASFSDTGRGTLLSAHRDHDEQGHRHAATGFRLVLAGAPSGDP